MKKIIICCLMLIIANATFSQQTKSSMPLTKQDYLQKSKNQKKTACILLGGGGALMITGIIIPKGDITHIDPAGGKSYKNDGIKSVFTQTGALAMLGSIPFFIASGKNKRRAISVSLMNEPVLQPIKNGFVYHPLPSLDLKISL